VLVGDGQIILAVLDGSKALAKAVRDVFGGSALVQRCQVHKMRNLLDQPPEDMRPSVREVLRQAYRSGNAERAERAKKLLVNLARRLPDDHPSAAASIDQGLDETLTVMRFGWLSKPGESSIDDERHREHHRLRPQCRRAGQAFGRMPR
jgi:transposase-like protein